MRRRIRAAALPLHRHSLPQLAVDGALVALAYYLAFQLRFEHGPTGYYSYLRERTIWWEKAYDAGSNGTNILKNLLGESGTFPFPKSVYAVRDALATVVGNRPNAVILDFFAGSATTFHARSYNG